MGAAQLAVWALTQIPALLQAGADVIAFVNKTNATVAAAQAENRDISAAEWNALDAYVADLRKQAQA